MVLIHSIKLCTGVVVTHKATKTETFCKNQWSPETYTVNLLNKDLGMKAF